MKCAIALVVLLLPIFSHSGLFAGREQTSQPCRSGSM